MADTPIYSDAFTGYTGDLTGKGSPAWILPSLPTAATSITTGSDTAYSTSSDVANRMNTRPNATQADAYAEADVKFTRVDQIDQILLQLRYGNQDNQIAKSVQFFFRATGACLIYQRATEGGSSSALASIAAGAPGAPSWVAGTYQRVRAEVIGTTARLYVADTLILSTTSVDAGITAGSTAMSLTINATGGATVTADNFEWGAYAADTTVPVMLLKSRYIGGGIYA